MKNPCETYARNYLPAFRSLIAKGLIENYEFTQVAAAELLGTTQAAVSYYVSSKRGEKNVEWLKKIPLVKSTIDEIVNDLVRGTLSSDGVVGKLCELCKIARQHDQLLNMKG